MFRKYISVAVVVSIFSLIFSLFNVSLSEAASFKQKPVHQHGSSNMMKLKKKIVLQQIKNTRKNYKKHFNQMKGKPGKKLGAVSKSISSASTLTEVNYTGTLNTYRTHVFHFTTNGGTVTIQDLDSTDQVEFVLSSDSSPDVTYNSGDTLPAGDYSFAVFSTSDTNVSYNYKLSDIEFTNAPTDSPQLSISSPSSHYQVLSKSSTSYTVSGTSVTQYLEYSTQLDGANAHPISPTSSFSFNLPLDPGYNALFLHSTGVSGNEVFWNYFLVVPSLKRISGVDSYEVSANVYREIKSFFNLGTIVIASGEVFPDALSGGPLAYTQGAPILLTQANSLPASIEAVIREAAPTRAIILGGTGSVSTNVVLQLQSLGVTTVERIDGANRFEVSANAAEELGYIEQGEAVITSGLVYSDALSVSSAAATNGMPILLVQSSSIPVEIENYIKNHPEITKFHIIGGTGSVSDAVATRLTQLNPNATVDRIGGADRYEVSVNVTNKFFPNAEAVSFATGADFKDAITAAPLGSYTQSPIMLTLPSTLPAPVSNYMNSKRGITKFINIVGNTDSISSAVEQQLDSYLQ